MYSCVLVPVTSPRGCLAGIFYGKLLEETLGAPRLS